ncbi:FecR domain-containing protein [Paraburkholderia acidisoli]|uniref:FecR domain-containing protein n=1 Tax=Paraburkholderia acidisoli TaxID=2571748 RepID=UPI001E605A89|nr:FecR domain-containing protein [Paraburkholderia acidisoli]
MSALAPPPAVDFAALQAAADWYAALRADDATEAERRAWQSWLAADPAHARAWQHVEAVSERFAPLHDAGGPNAVLAGTRASRSALKQTGRRRALRSLASVAGVGLIAWFGLRRTALPQRVLALRADERTATGEQRELRLADGTRVWLDTASAIDIDYDDASRTVRLVEGQILVATAHDPQRRPFYVQTPYARLQALGTRFTVRLDPLRAQLDVFEGSVEIRTRAGRIERIAAGSQARFDADAIEAPLAADPAREAWIHGIVMANAVPLGELVDELARYRHGLIHVAPEVAQLSVIGVYPARDPDRALAMLADNLPIRVTHTLPWWTRITPR